MISGEGTIIAQTAGVIAAGLIALVFGLQKLIKGWKETSTESSIISLMHEELERMAKHNKVLSDELSNLQVEIVNLNKELRKLSDENQKLHQEVASLTSEVSRLQTILRDKDKEVYAG